jgi:hypothetical protein
MVPKVLHVWSSSSLPRFLFQCSTSLVLFHFQLLPTLGPLHIHSTFLKISPLASLSDSGSNISSPGKISSAPRLVAFHHFQQTHPCLRSTVSLQECVPGSRVGNTEAKTEVSFFLFSKGRGTLGYFK